MKSDFKSKPYSLLSLLQLEAIGDPGGSPGFAGGPYGYGKHWQLAYPDPDPDLDDPAEEPKLFRNLEGGDGPSEEVLAKLQSENIVDDPGARFRRDLPGFPRMNTLVDPEKFVPPDKDQHRKTPEVNKDFVRIPLIPTGKDVDVEPEYFGYGPIDGDDVEVTAMKETINNWKTTEVRNMGKIERSVKYNQLVEPRDFQEELPAEQDKEIATLDDPENVITRPGVMGTILAPQKHVPDNNEAKKRKKSSESDDEMDDVERLLSVTSPNPTKSSGKRVLIGQEDFSVVLEKAVKEAVVEALLEKSPPGMKKKVEKMKAAIARENPEWSEEKVANVAFGRAWNIHKGKKKKSEE